MSGYRSHDLKQWYIEGSISYSGLRGLLLILMYVIQFLNTCIMMCYAINIV